MSDPLREAALECLDAAVAWRVRATPENTERLTRAETALMRAALAAPAPPSLDEWTVAMAAMRRVEELLVVHDWDRDPGMAANDIVAGLRLSGFVITHPGPIPARLSTEDPTDG